MLSFSCWVISMVHFLVFPTAVLLDISMSGPAGTRQAPWPQYESPASIHGPSHWRFCVVQRCWQASYQQRPQWAERHKMFKEANSPGWFSQLSSRENHPGEFASLNILCRTAHCGCARSLSAAVECSVVSPSDEIFTLQTGPRPGASQDRERGPAVSPHKAQWRSCSEKPSTFPDIFEIYSHMGT